MLYRHLAEEVEYRFPQFVWNLLAMLGIGGSADAGGLDVAALADVASKVDPADVQALADVASQIDPADEQALANAAGQVNPADAQAIADAAGQVSPADATNMR